MPLSNIKKILFSTLFFPSLCYANLVSGIGEFYFGPDTSENTACEYAFQRSKQDAIQRAFGEEIESFTQENCSNEKSCTIDIDTFTQMFGNIKQILKKDVNVYEDYGKKVCKVIIDSIVERVDNRTKFKVSGKNSYFEGEELDFSVVSNLDGYVSVYNFYENVYNRIHEFSVESGKEIKIKKDGQKIKAFLPRNVLQTKELLVIVFSKEKPNKTKRLNSFEFTNMINSLDSKTKSFVFRYVTIGKKL